MSRRAGAAALAAVSFLLASAAAAADMTVTVLGEVARPGPYPFAPGARVSELLDKAGGFTDAAFPSGAMLTRRSAVGAQAEELQAIARRIAAEARRDESPREREAKGKFLAAIGSLVPLGRVPVRLAHPRLMKGTVGDIVLEDGDVLTVPASPGTVVVAGAVTSPGAYPVRGGAGYRDYIRAAGGGAPGADMKKAWLLAADGTEAALGRPLVAWDAANARWELTPFRPDPVPVGAGDTIVVPRKTAGIRWPGGIADIDALLARIAILTGKVVVP